MIFLYSLIYNVDTYDAHALNPKPNLYRCTSMHIEDYGFRACS